LGKVEKKQDDFDELFGWEIVSGHFQFHWVIFVDKRIPKPFLFEDIFKIYKKIRQTKPILESGQRIFFIKKYAKYLPF
jgi:hypothetical protein